jgi:hypothetical protein
MFIVPPDVPEDIALAVHRVMHNTATCDDWELLDKFDREVILANVKSICMVNKTKDMQGELEWWSKELKLHDN